jgi:pimeloyl-ACP methyl ester carboxylesterase
MTIPAPPSRPRRHRRAFLWTAAAAAAAVVAVTATALVVPRVAGTPTDVPDVAALAGELADQALQWEECTFQEDIPNAAPPEGTDLSNLRCASIEVPKDWTDPVAGETWHVRIAHAENIDVDDPDYRTTVLTHPGGPVTPGLSYAALVQSWLPDLRDTTNYVSFDQRGLGQSSHASCDYEYVHDPADEDAAVRAIAEACAADADVATMTTEQAAYDMDFIRHLLGLETVTFYGASYGTWIGSWYATLFAPHVERMLFDSAVDFTQPSIQALYESAYAGRDRQFRLHLMNHIARHDATLGLGDDPEAIWERYFAATSGEERSLAAAMAWTTTGINVAFATSLGYPAAGELVAAIIRVGETAEPGDDVVALTTRMIESVAALPEGTRTAAIAAIEPTIALYAPPPPAAGEVVQGTFDSLIEFTKCTDGEWTQGARYWDDFTARAAAESPFSEQLLLVQTPICAFWPSGVALPEPTDEFPETLVLQSELDAQTPFEQGRSAALGLPNTSLIAVDNESAHGIFPYGTDEVDAVVGDFLAGGERPPAITVVDGKPIGGETETFESWRPIAEDGRHDGEIPRFTDPHLPADTPTVP